MLRYPTTIHARESPLTVIGLLDMVGTFFFGLSGAMLAVRKNMDLLGVLVLACVTAFGGGVTRDVVINNLPPVAFQQGVYIVLALAAGVAVFFGHKFVAQHGSVVALFDAVGLGAFTVIGARLGLAHAVPWWSAVLVGMMTGVVGGVLRDILGGEIPLILRREIYATASLSGAIVYLGLSHAGIPDGPAAVGGAGLVVAIRIVAIRRGWGLPHPGGLTGGQET